MLQLQRWEWYKLLVKSKGIIVLVVYITIHCVSMALPTYETASLMLEQSLRTYYQEYGGEVNDDTVQAIELKYRAISDAVSKKKEALADYRAQKISDEELNQTLKDTECLAREKRAFDKFYAHYQYCAEDPINRHLIETESWSKLLSLRTPDFMLIIFTILLTSLIWIEDSKQDINPIIRPTYFGGITLLISKWIVAVGISFIIAFCSQMIDVVFLLDDTSLQDGNSPLRSISYFASSPYRLTIWQAFLLGCISRFFGIIYCGLITVFCAGLLKNVVLGAFCSLASVMLPYVAGGSDFSYLKFPIPTGFVQAYLYQLGRGSSMNLNTLIKSACISGVIILTFCVISILQYGKVKIRISRKVVAICCSLIVLLNITGCSSQQSTTPISYASGYSQQVIEATDYFIYQSEGIYMVVEKKTNVSYELLNDPLEPDDIKTSLSLVKAVDNVVYFMLDTSEHKRSIQSIDLDTGERRIVYIDDYYGQSIKAFDVIIWEGPAQSYEASLNKLLDFFVFQDGIILLRGESITYLHNEHETVLYEGYYSEVTSNGKRLFFTNGNGILCEMDRNTSQITQFSNLYPIEPKVMGDKVFYLDPSQGNALCSIDLVSGECVIELSGNWKTYDIENDGIAAVNKEGEVFYLSMENGELSEVETDKIPQEIVLQKDCSAIIAVFYESTTQASHEVLILN